MIDKIQDNNLLVYVPCPIVKGSFAGWEKQIRRISDRNINVNFKFIYSKKELKSKNTLLNIFRIIKYAIDCKRLINLEDSKKVILFPVFYLPNILVSIFLLGQIPFVVRISGGELTAGNPISYLLRVRQIRKANAIIALNNEQKTKLNDLGVDSNLINKIPNVAGLEFVPPNNSQKLNAKNNLKIPINKFVIGSVGTICKRKSQHTIIQAVGKIYEHEIVVVLCGPKESHPEADPEYAEFCKNEADRLNVPLIMTGEVKNVKNILWALDLFVLASKREGMPNSLVEAISCGLPTLGTNIPGISELFSNKDDFLFGINKSDQLASMITDFIEEKKKEMGYQMSNKIGERSISDQRYINILTEVAF